MTENIFPSSALLNCVKSMICVELRNGVTIVGTLARSDGWMNLVLNNVQRFSADGSKKWKCPEVVVRGNSIKTIRVNPTNVKPRPPVDPQKLSNNLPKESGDRRGRDDGNNNNNKGDGPSRPKMSMDERNKKYAKTK